MSTIVTRSGKGSPLTHVEVDANFTNLNTDKYQEGSAIGTTTPAAGTFTTLTATGQTSLGGAAGSESLRVYTPSATGTWLSVRSTAAVSNIGTEGASLPLVVNTNSGIFSVRSSSFGGVSLEQMRVAHTASAVNYVQVTGAATTAPPAITVQGSDTNIRMNISSKGTESVDILTNNTGTRAAKFTYTASSVNWVQMTGAAAGASPSYAVAGSDTNIDLTLTPKGTGNVRFGTYTANMALTIQGYIEIKDSGGTTRRLAVIA